MKIKVGTYRISVTNKAGEKQVLNYFTGEDDFFEIVNQYCEYVYQNVKRYTDTTGKLRTFTTEGRAVVNIEDRYTYGYFDSAYTGDFLKIKEPDTNAVLYNVQPDKLQSRNFFFMISVPKNSKYAYLVIQRKENHGVKKALEDSFSEYLRFLGYADYKVHIEDAPSYYLLETMLEQGKLKEIKLISNSLKSSFQEQFAKVGVVNEGSYANVISFSKNSNTGYFRNELFGVYRQNYADYQQIFIGGEYFDEVSFAIELNDLHKTFYVKRRSRTKSNIDITNLIEIENGEPTLESIIHVSLDIISRLIGRNDPGEQYVA